MHNLSTSSHATPIEFTHIDYHLVEDPSQKIVVDLGSRIPSLSLDTTLKTSNAREPEDQVRLRFSVAQVSSYTQEGMFLRGSLDLAPVSLLANPQLETPFCTQKITATSSPAGCPGKGQPRDIIDGGSKVVYANQNRGRKTRPSFSVKETPSPARTIFNVRRKTNATGRAPIYWTPPPRAMLTKPWKRNPAKFLH